MAQRRSAAQSQPSFEEAMAQLEDIIDRIESGRVGLEEAMAEYERGVALVEQCRAVLDRVEQRVADLTRRMNQQADASAPTDQAEKGQD